MKLIGSYTSPYVRKISVMLLEKGITFEFVNDVPWEAATHVPDFNPLGKVPALVTAQGEVFYDSPVVAGYVELLGAAPAFLPADPMEALRVRRLESLADGVTDAAVAILLESRRPAEKQDEHWVLRQRNAVNRGLDALEKHAAQGEWLGGEQLTLADVAVGCCIGYLNFRRLAPNWCVNRPALVRLAERLFARESFARTEPPQP